MWRDVFVILMKNCTSSLKFQTAKKALCVTAFTRAPEAFVVILIFVSSFQFVSLRLGFSPHTGQRAVFSFDQHQEDLQSSCTMAGGLVVYLWSVLSGTSFFFFLKKKNQLFKTSPDFTCWHFALQCLGPAIARKGTVFFFLFFSVYRAPSVLMFKIFPCNSFSNFALDWNSTRVHIERTQQISQHHANPSEWTKPP